MTARRSYRLGKRAAAVEQTRRRILEAAFGEFTEKGIRNTSLLAVARRADVASGTVLYHFPTIDALAVAVVDDLQAQVGMPAPGAIPTGMRPEVRVRRLIELMYRFYERTSRLYPFFRVNEHHPVLQSGLAEYQTAFADLIGRTAGRKSALTRRAALAAITDVSFYASLTGQGLSTEQAIKAATVLAESAVGHR